MLSRVERMYEDKRRALIQLVRRVLAIICMIFSVWEWSIFDLTLHIIMM